MGGLAFFSRLSELDDRNNRFAPDAHTLSDLPPHDIRFKQFPLFRYLNFQCIFIEIRVVFPFFSKTKRSHRSVQLPLDQAQAVGSIPKFSIHLSRVNFWIIFGSKHFQNFLGVPEDRAGQDGSIYVLRSGKCFFSIQKSVFLIFLQD